MALGLIRQAAVPSLPSVDSPDFLFKLKGLLDVREGHTRNDSARFVTLADLEAIGVTRLNIINKEKVVGDPQNKADTIPPAPPTNFSVVNDGLSHTISWTNPVDDDLYTIEVFRSLVQDRNEAKCVAVATAPSESVTLTGVLPTIDYYYWIRAVDTSDNYSIWVPNNEIGGWLVQTNLSLATTKILGLLNGSITENDFTTLLRGKITKIGENTSAIEVHSAALNGISAEYYVKTDVNGYVSGFGLSSDAESSSFVIVADRFAVVKPGASQGAASVTPFVVGEVGGVSTVGINGNLIVDGTVISRNIAAEAITAEKIAAGSITAEKIGADEIDGDHISAMSSIILEEGGRLTVGNNNVMLDSIGSRLIIAPDNGLVAGEPSLLGHDYCELAQGDVNFMYWNGSTSEHQVYNSLKRVEVGVSVPNNVVTTIPGIWKRQPRIIVSPADIMSYNKNYVANQTLVCNAENITQNGLTYSFTPRAYLRLTDGVTGTPINLAASCAYDGYDNRNIWYYANTATLNTPANTTALTVTGTISGSWARWVDETCSNGLDPAWDCSYWAVSQIYVRGWLCINGVEYYIGEWTSGGISTTWSLNKAVTGLTTGVHSYYLRMGVMNPTRTLALSDTNVQGWINGTTASTNQSTFTSLSSGTLNYMAVGE